MRRLLVVTTAAMLAGCTTIEPSQLSETTASRLHGQNVAIVIQEPTTFGAMKRGDVALGPLGIPVMALQGERLRKAAGIVDPADDVADTLADVLVGRHAAVLLPGRGHSASDEAAAIVAAAPPGARYVLTVGTLSWAIARIPFPHSPYYVSYLARARLIDVQTKAVIAEGGCLQAPDGTEVQSEDYDQFTSNNAQLVKTELAARVDRCVHFIKRDMLGA
jgi:predicted component of type VI protein secretion system